MKKYKYEIRRAIFAIVTLPLAFAGYGVVYFGIGLLTATNTASVPAFLENLWAIGFAWVVCFTLATQIIKWGERITRP